MPGTLVVTKAGGQRVPFDRDKLRRTCLRAGADGPLAEEVARRVEARAYPGIPTRKILQMALALLAREQPPVAARYDLKGALMRLGPAGFEFEALVAELLERYGWKTRRNAMVRGACAEHEVDVIARGTWGDGLETAMVEVKYHHAPGIFTGLKEAMYTWARLRDLQEGHGKGLCEGFDRGWLVCNTKFSEEALRYSACRGLALTGWSHPPERSLRKLLEEGSIYPVTVLWRLDPATRRRLADAGLMLCRDLVEGSPAELARRTGVNPGKMAALAREAASVLEGGG